MLTLQRLGPSPWSTLHQGPSYDPQGLRRSPRPSAPGGAPAPHLQGTEAAVQIIQPGGKDELLIGTTQDLERQDSHPDLHPLRRTHPLLPAPKGLCSSESPWFLVQPLPTPGLEQALGARCAELSREWRSAGLELRDGRVDGP